MNKKKICIDISNIIPGSGGSGGGIATYALNLIKGLNQSDAADEFEIYCLKHPRFKGLENCDHVKISNIGIENKKLLYRIYWIHVYLPFFCIRNRINILHRVTPELPFLKVCKYVCTLHDLMFDFYLSKKEIRKFLGKSEAVKFYFFRMITKHAAYISDKVIVPSYAIKNELIEKYKTRSEKIEVTHEASTKRSNEISYEFEGSNNLHIGVIAGFYPHKGHLRILELAHQFINCGFKDFKISFRGSTAFPAYIKEIETLKEKLLLNNHVFIVGFDPSAKLEQIYSEFDIVLLLSEYEGFGLPVLEAQANNLPVFCSDIPVFREILGDSAYFISNNFDIISVENIILDLKNHDLLKKLSLSGMLNVNKFSWEKMSMETTNLYKKAIKI
jgi:glycosyltransferase involved in cell wall biosynthesis